MPSRAAAIQCPPLAGEIDAGLRALLAPAVERGALLAALPGRHGMEIAGYAEGCARIAAELKLWLVTGSYVSEGYPEAAVISPDGLIGTQRQTHLGVWERERSLARGDSLDVFDSPVGKLGLILGEDIRYPEVARILALQGAEVLVHLSAVTALFHEEAWLGQLWREAQANQTFGIQSCLVGNGYTGRSAILAPVEMTEDDTGILAQASTTDAAGIVIAEFDHDARRAVIADYPIFRYFNTELYARELLPAYGEAHE